MIRFVILILSACLLSAQEAPYDVFPEAEPPYYRVRYEASEKPGELAFAVNYTLWIPPGVETLRGVIVHQHGCGVGSCKSGLSGAWDLHWQALAKKHKFALMAPAYEQPEESGCKLWCDPRNGSSDAFQRALIDLGKLSGHRELSTVPWALWGHSGGGYWSGGMVMLHPERVAAAWLRSGVPLLNPNPERPEAKPFELPEAALKVPIFCNLGTKEGVSVTEGRFAKVWPGVQNFYDTIAARGGRRLGFAVDPLTGHECGNQRYLAIPWFDACLTSHKRKKAAKFASPNRIKRGDRWVWMPSSDFLPLWTAYVKNTEVPDLSPPPSPSNLQIKDGSLTWEAEADLESGLAHFVIMRDGKQIATVPENSKNNFGRPIFQGLTYSDTPIQPLVQMTFTDPSPAPGKEHKYQVIAVNTLGLRSE